MKKALLIAIAKFTRNHHFRGMSRILRFLYSPEFREYDSISTVIDYDTGVKININTSSFIEWEIFFKGIYEPQLVDYFKRILHSNSIAVDVGANIGTHVLIMANQVGEGGKVFAFEPNKIVFKQLADNIKLNNFKNVVLSNKALSDKGGLNVLHAFKEGLSRQAMASFYTEIPNNDRVDMSVDTVTFDSLIGELNIKRIDLIKIDTEGNDFKVLLGMRESIVRFKPEIIFEYSVKEWLDSGYTMQDISQFFSGLNYSLYAISDNGIIPISEISFSDFDNILARPI